MKKFKARKIDLPGSSAALSIAYLRSSDLVLRIGFDSLRPVPPVAGKAVYEECGRTRRKKKDIKVRPNVPEANSIKKSPVSPERINCEKIEKTKALNPKAAKGNAVAVPR